MYYIVVVIRSEVRKSVVNRAFGYSFGGKLHIFSNERCKNQVKALWAIVRLLTFNHKHVFKSQMM